VTLGDEGERVHIFNGRGIDIPVVLAGTYRPILFWNEEERECLGRFGRLDLSSGEMFVHEVLASLMFLWVQGIYFGHLWHKVSIKVDSVVEGTRGGKFLYVLLLKDPLESFEGDR
jgi:hypothetical protein